MTSGQAVSAGTGLLRRAGLAEPRREATALVRGLTGIDPRLTPDRPMSRSDWLACGRGFRRRQEREPFGYITGTREFWGLSLAMRPGVFIPRPETELLVERALNRLRPGDRAADLCTGSGAVAVAVAAAGVAVDALDNAVAACALAEENASRHHLEHLVRVWQGDLGGGLPEHWRGSYDVWTCNPPYVDVAELAMLPRDVRDWEPLSALVAPEGWRVLYQRLAVQASDWLRPGGTLLCEVGAGQASQVGAICEAAGLAPVGIHADLAGIARVIEVTRK